MDQDTPRMILREAVRKTTSEVCRFCWRLTGRQVLGCWRLSTEEALAWKEVSKSWWQRGLRRALLCITAGLVGLQPSRGSTRWLNGHAARCRGVRCLLQAWVRDRGPLAEDGCTGQGRWGP